MTGVFPILGNNTVSINHLYNNLVSKSLQARVLEASELPSVCATVAGCADAEPLCVKIKDQNNATVNHHFVLDKCQLQLLKCQPGHVEVALVPMKFCHDDEHSKYAGVIKKRIRRHIEESTTEEVNETPRHHRKTKAVKQLSRLIGRSNVEIYKKVKRKSGRLLKKPGIDRSEATHTQNKFKKKPKPILRSHNVKISKGNRSNTGKNANRKPLGVKLAPNFLNQKQRKGKKKHIKPHVPGSLAAPLDYGAMLNNPNGQSMQGYTMDIDPVDPGNDAEENGEANQDVEGNEEDGGINGEGEPDEGHGVNGDGEADEDRGVNRDEGDANENGRVNEGDGGDNEGDGDAAEDGGVNDRDHSENERDGEVNEADREPDERDGQVNEADREPDERDGQVNEGDGAANEDRDVNEDDEERGVANEDNNGNVFWKGDEGNNANIERVGEDVENGDDGSDNVDKEGNSEDKDKALIARVKKLTNPGLWDSISNGLSVKLNLDLKAHRSHRT